MVNIRSDEQFVTEFMLKNAVDTIWLLQRTFSRLLGIVQMLVGRVPAVHHHLPVFMEIQ